jgi:hypothetical protein
MKALLAGFGYDRALLLRCGDINACLKSLTVIQALYRLSAPGCVIAARPCASRRVTLQGLYPDAGN